MPERCVVVLVVGEERSWREEAARVLRAEGYAVAPASARDPADILRHVVADILLIDVASLGAMAALEAIEAVRRAQPSIRVACASDAGRTDAALHRLCTAHVAKPHPRERLLAEMERLLRP